jgi:pimeloyl-ACP methyl ester carboxylesterase
VAPSTTIETILAGLWQELLRAERVGVHDDFFALGGNSLLAALMLARLQEHADLPLSLATLYSAPTIALLAKKIYAPSTEAVEWIQTICSGRKTPVIWLGHAPQPNWLKNSFPSDHSLLLIEIEGMDGRRPRHKNLESMAADYARRLAESMSPQPAVIAGFSLGGLLALETARQLKTTYDWPVSLFLLDPPLPGYAKPTGFARRLGRFGKSLGERRNTLSFLKRQISHHCSRLAFETIRRRQCQRLLDDGQPIPLAMCWLYFEQFYRQAIAAFQPGLFGGRLTLIALEAAPGAWDHWTASLTTNYHSRSVATDDHMAIVDDLACVRQWLGHLQEHLRCCEEAPVDGAGAAPHSAC